MVIGPVWNFGEYWAGPPISGAPLIWGSKSFNCGPHLAPITTHESQCSQHSQNDGRMAQISALGLGNGWSTVDSNSVNGVYMC